MPPSSPLSNQARKQPTLVEALQVYRWASPGDNGYLRFNAEYGVFEESVSEGDCWNTIPDQIANSLELYFRANPDGWAVLPPEVDSSTLRHRRNIRQGVETALRETSVSDHYDVLEALRVVVRLSVQKVGPQKTLAVLEALTAGLALRAGNFPE